MAKKVLVVDDEPSILNAVGIALAGEGLEVECATNAQEALDKMEETFYDLVIIDVFMPEMSGVQLCEKICANENLKKSKLMVLTVAKFSETGLNDLKEMGVLGYIRKPFKNRDLVQRVKALLA